MKLFNYLLARPWNWCFLLVCIPLSVNAGQRIVTLSPHLTEWVYSLQSEQQLVGVSAYSNYPDENISLPIVADYQGVDFSALLALEPDLVLAWGGGNKPQDIARLKSLGIKVYVSQPQSLEDIATEINDVAELLGKSALAQRLTTDFLHSLQQTRQQYSEQSRVNVFYYMWSQPLMTIGQGAWANHVLSVCGASNIFNDSPIDYPEVSVKQVLLRQPQLLIAASDQEVPALEQFWAGHREVITAPLITANGNALHRFTLRITGAIDSLCHKVNQYRQSSPQHADDAQPK
ncbi:cobalamin-binding protein [Alteromonas gilva]|uniref:Cobalamin-binding protein n=1 Tax=Alteromonas gilva TaxID=2987522 RepID=A0ABT5L656_9ALTE|nr:cobalamin-binding protein [Alteromonas gilva]MDC8832548.1 cobalamin-binding protein [Alteromonas gilva]